jgi:N-formylglutamate amidohydrolase
MEPTVYYVKPNGGLWQVARQAGAALSQHETKRAAVDAGRETAHADQPSRLVVQDSDGTVEAEWTYQDDALPSSG